MPNKPLPGLLLSRCLLVSLYLLALLCPPGALADEALAAKANNLLSYIAANYPDAVQGGEIRDQSLYRQQRRNLARALELLAQLPDKPGRAALENSLKELDAAMEQRRDGDQVRRRANAAADRLAALYQLQRSPAEMLPPGDEAAGLYRQRCAGCHGRRGRGGDGVPDLGDARRMAGFSLYDFYNTLDPTSPRPHNERVDGELNSSQRWALAVYVAGFAAEDLERPPAELAQKYPALVGLPGMATVRPLELPAEAAGALLWWRANPERVRALEHPLTRAEGLLRLAETAYRGGDSPTAYHQLMLARRDGYLPVRAELEARDQPLAVQLEERWQALRTAILADAPNAELIAEFQKLRAGLVQARARLEPPPEGGRIFRWALLLFAAVAALGLWLWLAWRRRRVGGFAD